MAKKTTQKLWGIWRDMGDKDAKGQFGREEYRQGWLRDTADELCDIALGGVALWLTKKGAGVECYPDEDDVMRDGPKHYATAVIERVDE